MGIFKCSHSWGFPQRWPEFNGKRNVDVQTCSKCGARRESSVQFGKLAPEQKLAEARA
jgi:sulfur relay (sulfurtransferase) complex TusBCD TusD component (DsrE family)